MAESDHDRREADGTEHDSSAGERGRLREELAAYQSELQAQEEELRQSRQKLEDSRNRYFHLFQEAPVGYLIVDRRGIIREANRAAEGMLELSRNLLVGRVVTANVALDDIPKYLKHEREAATDLAPVRTELAMRRPDGRRLHVVMSSQRVGDLFSQGDLLVTLTDVTELKVTEERLQEAERKLRQKCDVTAAELEVTSERLRHEAKERGIAETALRATEKQYQMLVENAGETIVVLQDGRFRFLNGQVREIVGWPAEELVGMEFTRLVYPDDRGMVTERYERRIKGEEVPSSYHLRVIDRQGRVRWVRNNPVRIEWEGRPAVLCFLADITNEKEMSERLANERELLRTVLENIPVVVAMFDRDGRVKMINREFRNVFGWERQDLEGVDIMEISYPDAEERKTALEFRDAHLGHWQDIEPPTKSGARVPMTWMTVRLGDGSYIGIGVDIRERKQAEAALQEAYFRLEAEHEQLERKNIALREVLAMFEKKRTEIKESVAVNIEKAVLPKLREMKLLTERDPVLGRMVEILETELAEIASPLMSRLRLKFGDLTAREQQVARMIGRGVETPEIARLLGLSALTVQKHRELIRKRLGLTGSRTNLEAYLRSLSAEMTEADGFKLGDMVEDTGRE